jgi:hypothetical protein
MTRWIALFTFALVVAVPIGFGAQAAKKHGSAICAAKSMDGKQTKWRCHHGQKCCFDSLTNTGTCVASTEACM